MGATTTRVRGLVLPRQRFASLSIGIALVAVAASGCSDDAGEVVPGSASSTDRPAVTEADPPAEVTTRVVLSVGVEPDRRLALGALKIPASGTPTVEYEPLRNQEETLDALAPEIDPDGNQVVYRDNRTGHHWVAFLNGSGSYRTLPPGRCVAWSWSGEELFAVLGDGADKRLALLAGDAVAEVLDVPVDPATLGCARFLDAGSILFQREVDAGTVALARYALGAPAAEELLLVDGCIVNWFSAAPDGRRVAAVVGCDDAAVSAERSGIYVGSVDGGAFSRVAEGGFGRVAWDASSTYVLSVSGTTPQSVHLVVIDAANHDQRRVDAPDPISDLAAFPQRGLHS